MLRSSSISCMVCLQEDECQSKPENIVAYVKDCRSIKSGSEEDLQAAVGLIGPVSVAVEASLFQFYE